MTIYKLNGVIVEKLPVSRETSGQFPTPRVSRMEPYISPTSEKEITTWFERDRDMKEAGAFDVRDLPKDHAFRRGRAAQLKELREAKKHG